MAETVSLNEPNTTTTILKCDIDLQNELSDLANRVLSTSESKTETTSNLYESFKHLEEEGEAAEKSKIDKLKVEEAAAANDLTSDLGDANDLICDDDFDDDSEYKLPEVDWVNLEAKLKEAQNEMNMQVSFWGSIV